MNTRPSEERVVDFTGRKLGPYRLRHRVGDGGYSTVYRAEHQRDGNVVAVKVLDPRADRTTIERFRREIELTRVLFEQDGNRHVICVFDNGEDDGLRWYAMEFLTGHNLRNVLQTVKGEGLQWDVAAFILQNVCYAVAKMHDREVIHRDLKPDNIILERTATGQIWVKVIDLGIAKEISIESKIGEGKYQTSRNEIPGTGPYMAPERFSQALCTPATDQYSLGVVLYECLHGRLPFPETDNISTIAVQAHGSRDGIFWKSLPREIRDIVLRAMKTDSRHRFPSVLGMGQALHLCLRGAGEYVDGQATTLRLLDQLSQRRLEPQPGPLVATRAVGDDDVTVKFNVARLAAELAAQAAEPVRFERLAAPRAAAAAQLVVPEAEAAETAVAARGGVAAAGRPSAEKTTTLETELKRPFLARHGARSFSFLKRSMSVAMIAIAGMTECAADARWRSAQEWLTRSPEPLISPELEAETPKTPALAVAPAKPARRAAKPGSSSATASARIPDKAPLPAPPEDARPTAPPPRAPASTAKASPPAAPSTPSPVAAGSPAKADKIAEPASKQQTYQRAFKYAKQVVREACKLDASEPQPSVEMCLELALDSRGVPTREFSKLRTTPASVEISEKIRECVLRIAHNQIKLAGITPLPPSIDVCFKLERQQ